MIGPADRVETGEAALLLHQRNGVFTIRVDGTELMSSRAHRSEAEMAVCACEHIRGRFQPRVLIGGLGMGFTLRAALGHLATKLVRSAG